MSRNEGKREAIATEYGARRAVSRRLWDLTPVRSVTTAPSVGSILLEDRSQPDPNAAGPELLGRRLEVTDAGPDQLGSGPSHSTEVPKPGLHAVKEKWRDRYEGSPVNDLVDGLHMVEFGDRIVLFGAALLLSVLPMVILLSAFANSQVDDDIARHLGLNNQGSRIVDKLFSSPTVTVSAGIILSLLLSLVGTILVARSIQTIYEKAFQRPHAPGIQSLVRCFTWITVAAGLLIGDAAVNGPLRKAPAGSLLEGVIDFIALTLFFWWTIHFLLLGRESWRAIRPAAIASALFWLGLGVFASLYFSSTIVSDNRSYGNVGVVFSLVTWFIAIGGVIALGAVVGVTWRKRIG